MYKCAIFEERKEMLSKDTNRVFMEGLNYGSRLKQAKAIERKLLSRRPQSSHRILAIVKEETVLKYAPKAEFVLLEGAPLSEFDCKCAYDKRPLTLKYRVSKLDRKDTFFSSVGKSRKALFDIYVSDDRDDSLVSVITLFEHNGEFIAATTAYCKFLYSVRGVNKALGLECLVQNIFVVINWLLMMKCAKHDESIAKTHAEVVISDDAKPSTRDDVPVTKLRYTSEDDETPTPDNDLPVDGPENTIVIDEDGNVTIKGKKLLRLTMFWLVCKHERVSKNGKSFTVKAHLRGPNRDCDAAKAALQRYLESGHDKIYSAT